MTRKLVVHVTLVAGAEAGVGVGFRFVAGRRVVAAVVAVVGGGVVAVVFERDHDAIFKIVFKL